MFKKNTKERYKDRNIYVHCEMRMKGNLGKLKKDKVTSILGLTK